MNKIVATNLQEAVTKVENIMTNGSDRNFKETFKTLDIIPHGELSATVIFEKKETGKKAAAFFFLHRGVWFNFFPQDSHLIGMMEFPKIKQEIEKHNWGKNFGDDNGRKF